MSPYPLSPPPPQLHHCKDVLLGVVSCDQLSSILAPLCDVTDHQQVSGYINCLITIITHYCAVLGCRVCSSFVGTISEFLKLAKFKIYDRLIL